MRKKRKTCRQTFLTFLLALCLGLTVMPAPAYAEGEEGSGEPEPAVFNSTYNDPDTPSWEISVPGDYVVAADTFVVIEGTQVTFERLVIESGARLEIVNDPISSENEQETIHVGALTCSDLQPAQDACLMVQTRENVPEQIKDALAVDVEVEGVHELQALSLEDVGEWTEFWYDKKSGKWIMAGGSPGSDQPQNWDRLRTELAESSFAFGDWNSDGSETEDDLIYGMAYVLYGGFKVHEGRYQNEGEQLGLAAEPDDDTRGTVRESNLTKLRDMLRVTGRNTEKDLRVLDSAQAEHTLPCYTVTFDVSMVEGLSEISPMEFLVYLIDADACGSGNANEQIIVRVGEQYYIRNSGSGSADFSEVGRDLGCNDTYAITIVTDQFTGAEEIEVFGNDVSLNEEVLSDKSAKNYYVANYYGGNRDSGLEILGKLAVYSKDFTGVVVQGQGEANEPLAWGGNTFYSIREAGESRTETTETSLFFGYSCAVIKPLTQAQMTESSVKALKSVEVESKIPQKAIKIEEVAEEGENAFQVSFLSDYYDCITLKLVFEGVDGGEMTRYLTINRVGIVIQNGMTAGDSPNRLQIMHGHDNGDTITTAQTNGQDFGYAVYATFYFPTASGVTTASDTSLYVTLTYKDGRTESRIVETTFFTPLQGGKCAMADYVIYAGEVDLNLIKVEAIAVENADDSGRFRGAKLGAGKGVSKDIEIEL